MGKKSKQQKKKQLRTTTKTPVGVARLQFPQSGEISGLTPVALSVSADKNSPAIVREILQNSLDAAKAAKRKCAHVRFSLENVDIKDVPGIEEYGKALKKVGDFCAHAKWPSSSRDIFAALNRSTAKKSLPVLFVADNGMGLDSGNMGAILSDGVNKKENRGASGSHGNGHFTTFNLSDLRYLLYGGVSATDGKLASGHAILASHQGDKDACGKDGYFVSEIRPGLFDRFHFPNSDATIPPLILDKLRQIESEWQTGALLAILDFNYFGRKSEQMTNLILGAAAQNFFVAIQRSELAIEVVCGDKSGTLTADNLSEVMENISPMVPKTPKFPNHKKAERFYHLFTDSETGRRNARKIEVDTDDGAFDVIYRESPTASTKIALCRNGMWITDHQIPMISVSEHFAEHAPFEALVLCDYASICELVVLAEGNLHNALHISMVRDPNKAQKLRGALQKVRKNLQEIIGKQSNDFDDDVFVEGDGSIGVSPGRNVPKREKIGPIAGTGGGGGEKKKSVKSKGGKGSSGGGAKPGNRISVRFVAVRKQNEIQIRIMPKESLNPSQEAELRLVRKGGGDISCDNPSENDTVILLTKVICNGKECAIDSGKTFARIGEINEGDQKTISVEFETPKVRGDYKVDCEFVRRERQI